MKYTITKVEITAVSVFEKYYHHNLFTFRTISLYSGPGIPSCINKKTDISMPRPNSCIILQDFLCVTGYLPTSNHQLKKWPTPVSKSTKSDITARQNFTECSINPDKLTNRIEVLLIVSRSLFLLSYMIFLDQHMRGEA